MGNYKNMSDIAGAVDENGDLLAVSLGDLREALGFKRLGVRVLSEIANELRGAGLGYFPTDILEDNEVPRYGDWVRVYTKRTQLGQLIESVIDPTDNGDERLRDASSGEGGAAAVKLARIKAIVTGE